jgi:hypothetical protein
MVKNENAKQNKIKKNNNKKQQKKQQQQKKSFRSKIFYIFMPPQHLRCSGI